MMPVSFERARQSYSDHVYSVEWRYWMPLASDRCDVFGGPVAYGIFVSAVRIFEIFNRIE